MIDPTMSGTDPKATPSAAARATRLRVAVEQLYFGYRAFTASSDRILEQRGLGRVHHRILYFVGCNSQISVNNLLGVLKVSKQALNAPLRQLIEMQLVAMDTATHDRRVRQLKLTATGAKLEAKLTGAQIKLLQAVFEQAGADAEAGWHQVMQCLCEKD